MWLVMEPTHQNEYQKTVYKTMNLKEAKISSFTSNTVYQANPGSWNIKQINKSSTQPLDREDSLIHFISLWFLCKHCFCSL